MEDDMQGTQNLPAEFGRMAGAMAASRHDRREMNARRRNAASERATEVARLMQCLGKSRATGAREQSRKAAADRSDMQHEVEALLAHLRHDMQIWSAQFAQQASVDRSALRRDVQELLASFRESLRDWSVKHAEATAAAGSELERNVQELLMQYRQDLKTWRGDRIDRAASSQAELAAFIADLTLRAAALRNALAVDQESRSVACREAAQAVRARLADYAIVRDEAAASWSGKKKATEPAASTSKAARSRSVGAAPVGIQMAAPRLDSSAAPEEAAAAPTGPVLMVEARMPDEGTAMAHDLTSKAGKDDSHESHTTESQDEDRSSRNDEPHDRKRGRRRPGRDTRA
jgi:hypothetical protein